MAAAQVGVVQPDRSGHTVAHHHGWGPLLVIALAQLMVVLDLTIVNIALPSAQHALGFNDVDRQWVVSAYSLAFGSLLLLGGRLADIVGRTRTFTIGIIGFAAASALGGAAHDFAVLVAARSLQGMFAALLAPSAFSLLTTTFIEPAERRRAFGVFGAVGASGAALGLIVGGLLTEYLDWRWTLYVNVVIAAFALFGAAMFLRRSIPEHRTRLDLPGVLLVSAGLFCVVYGIANAGTHTRNDWMTWRALAVGALLLMAFFVWQSRAKHPLLPLRVLGDRNRGAAFFTMLITGACMFGAFLFLSYYLQSALGYSPVVTGVAFLPLVALLMISAQLSTHLLLPRVGPKVVVPMGLLLAAAGMVLLTGLGLDSTYAIHVLPPLLLLGAGLGLAVPGAMSFATLGVQATEQGVASATLNTTQQIGGSFSLSLLSTVSTGAAASYVALHGTDPLLKANAALHGYHIAYWWTAAFYLVGAITTALLFRGKGAAGARSTEPRLAAPTT